MEVLGPVTGISGFRAPPEEMGSPHGVPLQELLAFIAATFQFAAIPPIGSTPLTFQHGQIEFGDGRAPIYSFVYSGDGVIANCRRTEVADLMLDRFIEALDSTFSSRYGEIKRPRVRSSVVVVKFDRGFSEKIQPIAAIERLITDSIDPRSRDPRMGVGAFQMKRILFGQEPGDIQPGNLFEALERQDFVIELRVHHDMNENVFFCSAPLTTEAHLKVLEQIESIAASG
jgi:hypothetical protein